VAYSSCSLCVISPLFFIVLIFIEGFILQESLNDVPRTQHELSTVPPTPDELPTDTSIASNPTSPVVEAASNTADHLILPQDSSPPDDGSPEHVSDPVQLSIVTRSRSSEWSPDSIVLDSLQAQQQTGLGVVFNIFNSLNPSTNIHILLSVLLIFPVVLIRRICFDIISQHQHVYSPHCSSNISYRTTWKNLLKHQEFLSLGSFPSFIQFVLATARFNLFLTDEVASIARTPSPRSQKVFNE